MASNLELPSHDALHLRLQTGYILASLFHSTIYSLLLCIVFLYNLYPWTWLVHLWCPSLVRSTKSLLYSCKKWKTIELIYKECSWMWFRGGNPVKMTDRLIPTLLWDFIIFKIHVVIQGGVRLNLVFHTCTHVFTGSPIIKDYRHMCCLELGSCETQETNDFTEVLLKGLKIQAKKSFKAFTLLQKTPCMNTSLSRYRRSFLNKWITTLILDIA